MKIRSKGKTSGTRLKTDTSDLLLFQKQLDDRIRLFEEEKETENVVANKVKLLLFHLHDLRSPKSEAVNFIFRPTNSVNVLDTCR